MQTVLSVDNKETNYDKPNPNVFCTQFYSVFQKKPAMHTLGSRPNLGKKFQNTLQRILIYTYIKTVTVENCTSPQTYR